MKLQSINPHDQSIIGETEASTVGEIESSIKNAHAAFKGWKNTPAAKRAEFVKKYCKLMEENKEELARLTALEMGKPLHQELEVIEAEVDYINFYINEGVAALADEIVYKNDGKEYRVTYEPYGVCACIAPWNYPTTLFNSGVLPALIVGNTVVFKPDEHTILTQKLCGELLLQSGLPEGVFSYVIGAKDVGAKLIDSQIDLVWFTGSTKVGQSIYEKCGQKFIKGLMEMGGSSAGIIFADADLKSAVESIYSSRFSASGQVCNAVKRLLVEKSVVQKVTKLLIERLNKTKMGNPLENPDFGPLSYKLQLEILEKQVHDSVKKGAKIEYGGKKPTDAKLSKGNYYEPTLLSNVSFDMPVMNEETFGPVLPIITFETEDEAIELANNTIWGLGNEVYTSDLKKGNRVAKQLDSGVVGVNTSDYFRPSCPFGGYKKSGMGREYGKIGMQEFAQVKLIAVSDK